MDAPVAIVGGGVMGLSAAWALGERGVAAWVLDPLPRRTERNASNDESKVFRLAYAEQAHYSTLALRSLEGWKRLEQDARRPLLQRCGALLLGRERNSFARRSAATLAAMGREPWSLDRAALERAHPAFAGGGFDHAVLDRDGGMLDPPAILESLEAAATARRARVLRGARVMEVRDEGGGVALRLEGLQRPVRARACIVAAGHRAPLLLPELEPLLRTTRQPEFAFAPPAPEAFAPPALPVFAAFEDGFYGFPMHRGAVKVADHRKGPGVPWEPPMDPPTSEEERGVRGWLARAMPLLAGAPLARSRLCHYDNTPDDDFLLGPHPQRPRLLLALGFSGHGFKFAPAVGEALADLVQGKPPDPDWGPCHPGRFLKA